MESVYNSPPNWPPPPAGWRPPPGWTPDPSWPEPPQNWPFWVAAPTPPPARKKGRLWLVIGLPLAVLAVIVASGMIAVVVFMGNLLGPAKEAASSYVQALQDQRYDAAFAMRCSHGAGDHDEFVARWTNLTSTGHGVTGFKVLGTSVENINGTTSGQVDLEVRYADGSTMREHMTLTKTGDTWTPCS